MATRLVDLSVPIYHEMPIWSGEPKTGVVNYFKIGREAGDPEIMNMKVLSMCGHAGTHTDAPYHLVNDGATLDELDIGRWYGPARVVRFADHPEGQDVTVADVESRVPDLAPGARLLFHFGWDRHLGTSHYFDREAMPKLSIELMRWLNEKAVGLVGVGTPSVNPYLDRHVVIFESDNPPVVVELLTRLGDIPDDITLIALPLKIREGDGSPVRAVAAFDA
jgi:arylformamidase